MQLWETDNGDKWLCADCLDELKDRSKKGSWRMVFDRLDPELRCAHCGLGDVDVED